MEQLKFTSLTKEQLSRLDISLEIPPEEGLLYQLEPNISNVFKLMTHEECSSEELELAREMFGSLSLHGQFAFMTDFCGKVRTTSWFKERFKTVNTFFASDLLEGVKKQYDRVTLRARGVVLSRARTKGYDGPSFPLVSEVYYSAHDLLAENRKVIKTGSSFKVLGCAAYLEHGAVDALVDQAVGGITRVILFPDELTLLKY